MSKHTIGTHDEWLAARLALLERERELTHLSDKLAEQRRELPWVAVEKDYRLHARRRGIQRHLPAVRQGTKGTRRGRPAPGMDTPPR